MNGNLDPSSLLRPQRCYRHSVKLSATNMSQPSHYSDLHQPESWRGRERALYPQLADDAVRFLQPLEPLQPLQPRLLLIPFCSESFSEPLIHQCPKKIQEDKVLNCARHWKKKKQPQNENCPLKVAMVKH